MSIDIRKVTCPYQRGWAAYLTTNNQRIIFTDECMVDTYADLSFQERVPYKLEMDFESANHFVDDRKKRLQLLTPNERRFMKIPDMRPVLFTPPKGKCTIRAYLPISILLLIYPTVLETIRQSTIPTPEEKQIVAAIENVLHEYLEYLGGLDGRN